MATVDITIMGAGIFGMSIAWACARRGAKVRVVDPRGVGGGASGGVVGALAPHTPERWEPKKAFQFESLIMAEDFWAEVDAASGLASGYGRTGRLQPIADDHTLALARERVVAAVTLWEGKAKWQVCQVEEFTDWVPTSPTGLVVHDTLTARIDPRRACDSLARALSGLTVQVVPAADPEGRVVWATGYEGLLEMSRDYGREVGNGVKGQAVLFKYDAGDVPQYFTEGLHFIAHDNGTVAVGSTSERYFDDPLATDTLLDNLIDRALVVCPQLAGAKVLAKWAGVRPRAKTRAPMLGAYPDRPGHFIANGGFKIGFGMAPKVAEIMADLVLDEIDLIPEEFRVEANL